MEFPKNLGGFKLTGELGAGAMGTVYRAEQINLGRAVVIKTLHPHLARNDDLIHRFQREAKSAATLQHPNTVQVIDYGLDGDLYFIAMEFVDGLDLKQIIQEVGAFPPAICLLLLRDVCRGMEAAHRHGIIHRDIKPANLMITAQGQVKVMDFGLAREAVDSTELTAAGSVMGTAAYMPPEQARGETDRLDHRADIFSTGLVGYEIAAGRRAFLGQTQIAIFTAVIEGRIDPLDSIVEGLPKGYADLIHWMSHKDLEDRCPTMTDALDRLEEMVDAAGLRRPELLLGEFVQQARASRAITHPDRSTEKKVSSTEIQQPADDAPTRAGSPASERAGAAKDTAEDSSLKTMVAGLAERPPSPSAEAKHEDEPQTDDTNAQVPTVVRGSNPEAGGSLRSQPSPAEAGEAIRRDGDASPKRWWLGLIPLVVALAGFGLWQSGVLSPEQTTPLDPTTTSVEGQSDEPGTDLDTTHSDSPPDPHQGNDPDAPDRENLPDGTERVEAANETGDPSPGPDTNSDPDSDRVEATAGTPPPTPDWTGPGLTTKLLVTKKSPSSATLSFVPPTENSGSGLSLPTKSLIAISKNKISTSSWPSLAPIPGVPSPSPGSPQLFDLDGLTPSTKYYLAIRTRDSEGRLSGLTSEFHFTTEATPAPDPPIRITSVFSVSANPFAEISFNGGPFDPNRRNVLLLELKEGKNTFRARNTGMKLDVTLEYVFRRDDPNNVLVLYLEEKTIEARFEDPR